MKQLIQQAAVLIRQNPFFSAVCIIGTAVTVAFVMVVIMVYRFRTADLAPETERSRMMYCDRGQTSRQDGTNINSGMGPVAFEALFDSLPGVEALTWYSGSHFRKQVCRLPASVEQCNCLTRSVAANWFRFFDYDFVAGHPFTQEEYDASRSGQSVDSEGKPLPEVRRSVVLTEQVASRLFGSADAAIGQEVELDFIRMRVSGVVRDVSSIFQTAYAEAFIPFSIHREEQYQRYTGGLGGMRMVVLKLRPDARPDDIRTEVERRQNLLNSKGMEYLFKMPRIYTHTEHTFFRDSYISARLVYGLLILVLLVVPAVSISGLMNSQMQSRLGEIAIRKAYGASNASLAGRLFCETLLGTLLGGVLGFLLSCLLVQVGRMWLFGSGGTEISGIFIGSELLFSPVLFLVVVLLCVVFNALSVILPVWAALRQPIASTLKG